ncbi:MAG: tetratricopeptide repeat protein [FCB group bacterium]|jgi:tetratricopeptide (TPR) repeat protein
MSKSKKNINTSKKDNTRGKIPQKPAQDKGAGKAVNIPTKAETIKTEKTRNKINWSINNPKIRLLIPFLFLIILYLFVWTKPEIKSIDPWYEAYMLVDSSTRETNPVEKQTLLNNGGNRLKELAQKYPFHAKVHLLLGVYYNQVQQWDSAIAEQKEAIKISAGATINPVELDAARQLMVAAFNKANIYLNRNDFVNARKALDIGLQYNPNNPDLLSQLGAIFHKQGIVDSAIYYYETVLNINPQSEYARNNLALLNFQLGNNNINSGNFEKALTYYQKSASLSPKNPDVFSNIGIILSRQNKNEEAIQNFQKALEINPNHTTSINNIIAVYNKIGDKRNADLYKKKYNINH